MDLALPLVDIKNRAYEFKPLSLKDSMLKILERKEFDENIMRFVKKSPHWSHEKHTYVLNFGKRVKKTSIKNTQLLRINRRGEEINDVVFQVRIKFI